MDNMSPQQQQDSLSRGGRQQVNKRVGHFYVPSVNVNRLHRTVCLHTMQFIK